MAALQLTFICDNCGKQHTEQRDGERCLYGIAMPEGWDYCGIVGHDGMFFFCSDECREATKEKLIFIKDIYHL